MSPATFALRVGTAAIACLMLLPWNSAGSARADSTDPLFVFYADAEKEGKETHSYPPAAGGFDGPCGLALSGAQLYVSDHYRNAVDVFTGSRNYVTRLAPQEAFAGPCQLAVAPGGILFVNYYHQGVVRYQPSPFPVTSQTTYGSGEIVDDGNSTGVAVDPVAGRVYVNRRDYVAVYDLSGAPVLDDKGVSVKLGEHSLGDYYGLAVSNYSTSKGYVYVADASDRTIKVFDPGVDLDQPVAALDGSGTPAGAFVSLKDAAVAVDSSTGEAYVVDNLQPSGFERPEAAVYAFGRDGGYDGRFKFNVVHGQPPGLTAAGETIYVTSGNTLGAAVYAYRASSLTAAVFPAPEALAEDAGTSSASAVQSVSVQTATFGGLAASTLAAPAEELAPRPAAHHRRKACQAHKSRRHHRSRARRHR